MRPERFSVVRRYARGPLEEMRVAVELRPEGPGTHLVYEVRARPRTVLGSISVPIEIGRRLRRRFDETIRAYDRIAASQEAAAPDDGDSRLARGGRERLAAASVQLVRAGSDPQLVERLRLAIERGDDLVLARMRPYELADTWGAERRAVLELFLRATRAGLLDLCWDLLCPLCRGVQESPAHLSELESGVHCESCGIDFEVNFADSVELTFVPNPAAREVDRVFFCVAGPQVTPHVALQQLLPPTAERTLSAALEPGRYRLRAGTLRGSQPILVGDGGSPEATVTLEEAGWPEHELRLTGRAALRLVNSTSDEHRVVLERTAWGDQSATAAEVTALQVFRDLFSNEVLRPGEPVSVGTLAVVFTDLLGSTRFYRELGDAPAFGAVADHLELLRAVVGEEGGAVVKTMGDAIMAVFRRPADAVTAVLRAQREAQPLVLKAGVHYGPCIAISQNDRLDYFGTTVNAASRLAGLSNGTDVVVSAAVHSDPDVAELALRSERVILTLKGFDDEPFEIWRLLP